MLGRPVTIDWTSDPRPTLIYLFSPGCHWCARNLANIEVLSAALEKKYRIAWFSLSGEGLKDYLAKHSIGAPVFTADPGTFGTTGTPKTLIISTRGQILDVWRGAYNQTLPAEIQSKTGVVLPGLLAEAALNH
jgi:hypothetical protein